MSTSEFQVAAATSAETASLPSDDLVLLRSAADGYQRLMKEMGRVIVGQQEILRPALAAVFCQGHSLIIGVPGLAKTLLVKTLSDVLSWKFKRIQFTPDLMPTDIVGMELLQEDPASGQRKMTFMPGPIFTNILLADEINRTPPKTQAALLEAMQEYTVTSMGHSHALAKPFIVFATQNPIEQEGTYPLPEAQLDRFMFSLWITYPSAEQEIDIVFSTTDQRRVSLEPVFTLEQVTQFQELVRRIPVSRHVVEYAVALARATRPDLPEATPYVRNYVTWGAGPRACQNMILGAKALAVIDGVPTVSAAHVREVAPWVLRHRILPSYQAAGDGVSAADIVKQIMLQIGEPSYEPTGRR
jgi:MoxR-like ATPase